MEVKLFSPELTNLILHPTFRSLLDMEILDLGLVEFSMSSSVPYSIGFGPNDTLRDVLDTKTTLICTRKAMNISRILFILCFKYLVPFGLVIGVFEVTSKILCKIGCKLECYTLQGLSKNHIWCKHRKIIQPSKVDNLVGNLMQNVSSQLGLIPSSIWWCQ